MVPLAVTYRKRAEITAYPRNARTHSEAQIAQIAASIVEFGWTNPLLVDERGQIIAGHGRLAAASLLGQDKVPTICVAGLSDAQRRALVIADNKLALNAGWDDVLLTSELQALRADDFDLALIGFGQEELDSLRVFGELPSGSAAGDGGAGSLAERFMVPPFSVLNAREGWWQERKRAWLALGIKSELGRGATEVNSPHEGKGMADGHKAVRAKEKAAAPGGSARRQRQAAAPGGSARPAADYSKRQRGDGTGRPLK